MGTPKIYPGPDSSTWPASGTMWHWTGGVLGPKIIDENGCFDRIDLEYGTIVFLAKVIYCTKSEITINFIGGEKVFVWTFPCSKWDKYFEKMPP